MTHTESKTIKARAVHRCDYCGEHILKGDEYVKWVTFDEGSAWTSKMHPECVEDAEEGSFFGEWDYTLYGQERPRVNHEVQ